MGLLLLLVLLVLILGGLPQWGFHGRGYAPSASVGTLLLILLILYLCGVIR